MNETVRRLKKKKSLDILNDIGVRPSVQRVAILSYLLDHDTHPTADTIYRDLVPHTPGLSKTTVYNTMKLFTAKGLVKELSIDAKQQRFDIMDGSHGHLLCTVCGRLFDVQLSSQSMLAESIPAGFRAEEYHLYIKGLCPDCS